MERERRVRQERRALYVPAHERWKAFQIDPARARGAIPDRDGSIPVPRVAANTAAQFATKNRREELRSIVESTAYRELRRTTERQIGATLDFADLPPDEQALKAGRPVARLVTIGAAGTVPEGFATGFLVAPDLLLTNHHVFRTPDEADGVGAQFLYERTQGGLRAGLTFTLEPARFFVNNKGLDYALVAVSATALEGASLKQFQYLPLIGITGKIVKGDPVNIIQHPEGRPKQYATVNNRLLDLRDDGFLLYETDTLEGSSGAPLFNQHWETIGLHHCGVPQIEDGRLVTRDGRRLPLDAEVADSDLIWVANEGIRVSALVKSLADQRFDRPEAQRILEGFLATTTDPLRIVAEKSPLVPAPPELAPTRLAGGSPPMADQVFNFSGPVTIYVNAPPDASTGRAVSTPSIPPEAPAADFREKTLKFDENYEARNQRGYKPGFLTGWSVPAPHVNADHHGDLLRDPAGAPWVIPYYHYSLTMNRDRRLVAWAASNVDYRPAARRYTKTRKEYGGENWRLDPRIALAAPGLQIEDADFYAPAKKIDRGHIVRREDGAWGSTSREAEYGNSDTYHWTNCTPQSEAFNQSGKSGIWGRFEEHIQDEVKAEGGRMTVFAGPVLSLEDPHHGYDDGTEIQVPMEFWKVVVCVGKVDGQAERLAYGFVFDQTEPVQRLGYERMNMTDYVIYQMPVKEITRKTGVVFDASVLAADVLKDGGGNESIRGFEGKRIESLSNVVLR
jgi:endonuclease G, mitochondrial